MGLPQKTNNKPRKEEATWPLYLAAAIFLLGVYLVVNALKPKGQPIAEPDPRQAQLEHYQKVQFYKKQLGQKLNRERTYAEHELTSEQEQPQTVAAQTYSQEASVDGLPMDYEKQDWSHRDESKEVENYRPDQRVAYNLRDDQQQEFWEEEAQRMFLRQYIINARQQGYDVAIGSDYTVIVKKAPQKVAGQRFPQSVQAPLESFHSLRFAPPFFIQPICSR